MNNKKRTSQNRPRKVVDELRELLRYYNSLGKKYADGRPRTLIDGGYPSSIAKTFISTKESAPPNNLHFDRQLTGVIADFILEALKQKGSYK
jgi:hypothetical protein